jgi:hypothetical protein
MAGNFPFAIESLSSLQIIKQSGQSLNIIPWGSGLNPLISFTLNESMFSPLMTGTLIIRDTGDWLRTYGVKSSDEIRFNLKAKKVSGILHRDRDESIIKNYDMTFEITNVKNTVTLSSDEYQTETETIKALTIEFIAKNVLNKEFLSSALETENFIGPIYSDEIERKTLSGEVPTSVELIGFNKYLKQKFNIKLDGDRTFNYCYLKRNNISYPWGKIQGQPTILQTLQYLAENAVSNDNNAAVNYVFWQDLDGFHFKCIDSMIKNSSDSEDKRFVIGEYQFAPNNIHSFETISEFDNLKLLNSNVYYSWYERIIPNYEDPYLDFVSTSEGLKRETILFDIQDEYNNISHVENTPIITLNSSSNSELSQSQRIDDDVYGFYSNQRYNTPFPQSWEYIGLSADTRSSSSVWQNQFDLDNEVKPEIIYAYDKLIKNASLRNREKFIELKNLKKKWEVYRCSICCTEDTANEEDKKIKNIGANDPDYNLYFGPNGIFKEFAFDEYKIVAAGSFSDVVNYEKPKSKEENNENLQPCIEVAPEEENQEDEEYNGLTLSYDMNSLPYNQSIKDFYNLDSALVSNIGTLSGIKQKYQSELSEVNTLIQKIESLLGKIDGWITGAADLAFQNLTPYPRYDCRRFGPPIREEGTNCCIDMGIAGSIDPEDEDYNQEYQECVNYYGEELGNLQDVQTVDWNFDSVRIPYLHLTHAFNPLDGERREMEFGDQFCYPVPDSEVRNVYRAPLYVNLEYRTKQNIPDDYTGSARFLVRYDQTNGYVTKAGCKRFVDGQMAWELPYKEPGFLYECTQSKLITGLYTSNNKTREPAPDDDFYITRLEQIQDPVLNGRINSKQVFCATCLDFISLEGAKYEYKKVLNEKKLKRFILETLINKITSVSASYAAYYNEFLNRKAFFISKNPFDPGVTGNIVNKKTNLSLFNIKSIKRKPIRGSKYEVLANRIGITSGKKSYEYDVFFGISAGDRDPALPGNHPYYDQKFKGFTYDSYSYGAYASKPGFNIRKYDTEDILYYDDDLSRYEGTPGFNSDVFKSVSGTIFSPVELKYENQITQDSSFNLSNNIGSLDLATNRLNIFKENSTKIPSIEKEKLSSYVRIEFESPIGLDSLEDFPDGFVRDAGSEYFLPYLVQLTGGPNGRQTIQNNTVVIGMDPYGFDVAVKKNRTKNNYSDYKEWGNYWWYKPLNQVRLDIKTKDIPDMSLWAERKFENEYTFYQNNGEYISTIGEDFTEYDNYFGTFSPLYYGPATTIPLTNVEWHPENVFTSNVYFNYYDYDAPSYSAYGYYADYYTVGYYGGYYLNNVKNMTRFPTSQYFRILQNLIKTYKDDSELYINVGSKYKIENRCIEKNINLNNFKYGSYNLLGSHLHYNTRRSWYDLNYKIITKLNTFIDNIGTINNLSNAIFNRGFDYIAGFAPFAGGIPVPTIFKAPDFYAYSGNDFVSNFANVIKLKDNQPLKAFLASINNNNVITSDISSVDKLTLLNKTAITLQSIFADEIEAQHDTSLTIYRPGLVTSKVWKYDIFGESEYGLTSPPTLPPEYDLFDNNFAAQFVVYGKQLNLCKQLNLKCLNPQGYVDNQDCPDNDPYCNCPAKNLIPKQAEPSYKQLASAYQTTKECKLISDNLGCDYLGCMLSDPENVTSCGCPSQGENYPKLLYAIRTNATFYNTPPETPLRRQAQMSLITGQQAVMTIYPNDSLKIGDIITVFRGTAVDGKDSINGKWMITGITRIFKSINIEIMVVNLARDSTKI